MEVSKHLKRLAIVTFFIAMIAGTPGAAFAAGVDDARKAVNDAKALQELLASSPPQDAAGIRTAINGHLVEARKHFERAGASNHAHEAFFEYIRVLQVMEDFDIAAAHLERAVASDPSDGKSWIYLGNARLQMGPEGCYKAVPALRRGLESENLSPEEHAAGLSRLGEAYYQAGLFEHAAETWEQAVAGNGEAVEAIIGLSILDVRAGRLVEGAERLDALGAAAQPFDANIRARTRDALAFAEANGMRVEDSSTGHSAYAKTMYRAGRISTAILALQRAISMDPGNAGMLNILGGMHHQLGNPQEALSAFEKSLEVDPNQTGIQQAVTQLKSAVTQQETQTQP